MPELLGFREKNGKVMAVINFPKARKFTLLPADAAKERRDAPADHKNEGSPQ